jgi:hypothetical protein
VAVYASLLASLLASPRPAQVEPALSESADRTVLQPWPAIHRSGRNA